VNHYIRQKKIIERVLNGPFTRLPFGKKERERMKELLRPMKKIIMSFLPQLD